MTSGQNHGPAGPAAPLPESPSRDILDRSRATPARLTSMEGRTMNRVYQNGRKQAWIIVVCMLAAIGCADAGSSQVAADQAPIQGWLHWRGPQQNGTSTETNLPQQWEPGGANHRWSIDLPGRGTPVVAQYGDGARVFAWGYRGEKADLVEVLLCLDAQTGRIIWEQSFPDFISDIIYNRYAIGSPTVDPETGNVYLMTSPGLLVALDRDGHPLWQRSMMEAFGRLTFPNGRTGAPSIDGDRVIVNAISTNWGREGPARNRFYAFDKHTGDLIWSSTPGVGPPFLKDSSFCSPVFARHNDRRVFYAGTGCGNVVSVDAETGAPLWRYQLAIGGVNSSVVLHAGNVIAIHGKENVDDTGRGRMVAIRGAAEPGPGAKGPVVLEPSAEIWRNDDLSMFTSSPVIVGDRVYQMTAKGDLVCVDANTGQTLWSKKLGADQLHASPLYADGKLYVPMWHDGLYIVKPTDAGAQILDHVELEGLCIGSPSVWNGHIYVHTTKKLYCFAGAGGSPPALPAPTQAPAERAARVVAVPAEVLLRPGESRAIEVRTSEVEGPGGSNVERGGSWRKFIPPTAKVRVTLDGDFDGHVLTAAPSANRSAGAFAWEHNGRMATIRARILPSPPYDEDFESFETKQTARDGIGFAYPPLAWIGARLKWQIRQVDGNKVLAKTLDRVLFQRSMVFIGHPDDRNYTIAVDVMSDGNRRIMSSAGVVNQRYIIALIGNAQILEVVSNHDRLKTSVPFRWKPKQWYRMKTQVDVGDDGSGVIRAKAWKRDLPEPDAWTIEVTHEHAHRNGAPGLWGFSPQSRFRVYLDNVSVTPSP